MTFIALPIKTGLASTAIGTFNNQNNPVYGEHPDWPNGHVYVATYVEDVGGTDNVFVCFSTDWCQTWTHEQVTFMTGGSATGDQYSGSIAVDINGNGFHLVWYGKGYGQPSAPFYPSQLYQTSLLYGFRDSVGVWTTSIIQYSGDVEYGDWHPDFRYKNCTVPSIAIDQLDNVHLAYQYWNSRNFVTRRTWDITWYRKRDHTTGVWGELARFLYGIYDATPFEMPHPNLQVDYYGNPHITARIKKPNSSWGVEGRTTIWFCNDQQGAFAGWAGSKSGTAVYGEVSVNTRRALLYEGPASTGVSIYSRLALSHHYDQGTYDYPHCVYEVHHSGVEQGNFYKYLDGTGWHTEKLNNLWNADNPSIAIGADGWIYTLVEITPGVYEYRKRTDPASPWSTPENIAASLTSPRHLHQRYPIQYPADGQDCSPFMGMVGSQATLFRCGFPATSGYGYFM